MRLSRRQLQTLGHGSLLAASLALGSANAASLEGVNTLQLYSNYFREPLTLTPTADGWEGEFISHFPRDILVVADPTYPSFDYDSIKFGDSNNDGELDSLGGGFPSEQLGIAPPEQAARYRLTIERASGRYQFSRVFETPSAFQRINEQVSIEFYGANGPVTLPLTNVADYQWRGEVDFSEARGYFKFSILPVALPGASFADYYGDNQPDQTLDFYGRDIEVGPARFAVEFDEQSQVYQLTRLYDDGSDLARHYTDIDISIGGQSPHTVSMNLVAPYTWQAEFNVDHGGGYTYFEAYEYPHDTSPYYDRLEGHINELNGTFVEKTPDPVTGIIYSSPGSWLTSGHYLAVIDTEQRSYSFQYLGDSDTDTRTPEPALPAQPLTQAEPATPSSTPPLQVSSSSHFTCATHSGQAQCWGKNTIGQLGLAQTAENLNPTTEQGQALLAAALADPYLQLGDRSAPNAMGDALTPLKLGDTSRVVGLSHGLGSHHCAILDTGGVKCWGANHSGQLGIAYRYAESALNRGIRPRGGVIDTDFMGDSLPLVNLGSTAEGEPLRATQVATAADTWGDPLGLIAGLGAGVALPGDESSNLEIVYGRVPQYWYDKQSHSCALLENGRIKCWGFNRFGQLGLDDSYTRGEGSFNPIEVDDDLGNHLYPVDLGYDSDGQPLLASGVGAGREFSCALLQNGRIKCWGQNNNGQLGLGHTECLGDGFSNGCAPVAAPADLATPRNTDGVLMQALSTHESEMGNNLPYVDLGTDDDGQPRLAQQLSVGESHVCALLDTGRIICWGQNGTYSAQDYATNTLGIAHAIPGDSHYLIGDDPAEMGNHLVLVDLGTDAAGHPLLAQQISAGAGHNCALLMDGRVKCWGNNATGQLGFGNAIADLTPSEVRAMGNSLPVVDLGQTAVQVSAGANHSCAVLADGSLKCWGSNRYEQLGLGFNGPENLGLEGDDLSAQPPVDLGQTSSALPTLPVFPAL